MGIDHSTTAIRVAILDSSRPDMPQTYELLKSKGPTDLIQTLRERIDLASIDLLAISYSMGDAFSTILPIEKLENRGVLSLDVIGPMTGIGTKMFDELLASGLPAIAIPGLHRDCPWLDPFFTLHQSHIASPKKVTAAFYCFNDLNKNMDVGDMIVANVSSNTISILVKNGKVVGGLDAVLGAPGLRHGPLDLETLRKVDSGQMTANEAFSTRGLMGEFETPTALVEAYVKKDVEAMTRLDTLIGYVAMEISGLVTVSGGVDAIAITGSLGEISAPLNISDEVGLLLKRKVHPFSRFSAAIGASQIAQYVKKGAKEVFGIPVG